MLEVDQYSLSGRTANEIVSSVEEGIRDGHLLPGDTLPSIREAAKMVGVSPATVASAYRSMRERGIVTTADRARTRISPGPPVMALPRGPIAVPDSVVDLASGNPDPAFLPPLEDALSGISHRQRLYGEASILPELLERVSATLSAEGLDDGTTRFAVVNGGLDGIERVLEAHVRPGESVAVEDPCYTGVLDLVRTMSLTPVPMRIDDQGPEPEAVRAALSKGARALIITPRNQNPTGAALTKRRAAAISSVLHEFPDVLIVEDDHASGTTVLERVDLVQGRSRWALVQSHAKALGPDLRLATVAGDPQTIARLAGRQAVGCGWVSHVLQRTVAYLQNDESTKALLRRAAETYDVRRQTLADALAQWDIPTNARSGFNLWIPVPEEEPIVRGLLHLGWAVRGGEAYRFNSPPAIRVTTSTITAAQATAFARDLAELLRPAAMQTRSA